MFFVDKPYISNFFKETIKENQIPIVDTDIVKELGLYDGSNIIDKSEAIKIVQKTDNPIVYMTSENSIEWITKNLAFSNLPEK